MTYDERMYEYFRQFEAVSATWKAGVHQDIFLAANRSDGNRPGVWIPSRFYDWDQRPAFRTVGWGELLFDIDWPGNWRKSWGMALRLHQYCENRMIPHSVWPSGGSKGIHVSIFLDAHGAQRDFDWSEIRASVYNHLCIDAGVSSDPSKIFWRDAAMGSLVRIEGGLRWVRSRIETWEYAREGMVPSYKHWTGDPPMEHPLVIKPYHVRYPPSIRLWSVPKGWLPNPDAHEESPKVGIAPRYDLPDIIRRLVAYTAGGGNPSDFARFSIGANLLRSGWEIDQIVPIFEKTPNFNERITRSRLENFQRNIDHIAIPGVRAIRERCQRELGEMEGVAVR